MSIFDLTEKAKELRELQAQIDQLTAEADTIRDLFKAKMIEEGTEELIGDGWKATWHAVTSTRLDTKALKAEEPGIYAAYSKTSTVCRFTLA